MADECGHILTEASERLLTESGDALVTECFSGSLMPGKVWKGEYPYFKHRRRPTAYSPPYGPKQPDYLEEEEVLILFATEID